MHIFNRIWFFLSRLLRIRGWGISILVPLHMTGQDKDRAASWAWVRRYLGWNLPGAEIIVGTDSQAKDGVAFSKSAAVNDAASRANGDLFVILDADVYITADTILHCAKEIRHARHKGYKLWFVPYRRMYRLTRAATAKVLKSHRWKPFKFATPPAKGTYSNSGKFLGAPAPNVGHWFGAMCQIVPREGFEAVGGWCPAFRGWGGEDGAAMFATDTLYAPHKTLPGQILHLWHPVMAGPSSGKGWRQRLWKGQTSASANDKLNSRFFWARGNRKRMRELVDQTKDAQPVSETEEHHSYRKAISS